MKLASFNAKCPFEIGDIIVISDGIRKIESTITDIACTHYVKSGNIQFFYEFNNSGKYAVIENEGEVSNG